MLLMDLVTLSVKLGRRLGAIDVDSGLSPIDALHELQILSHPAREALDAQREVRNSSQHVYVELTVAALREAVKQQLNSTPSVVTSIVSWVDSWPRQRQSKHFRGWLNWIRDAHSHRPARRSPQRARRSHASPLGRAASPTTAR